MARTKKNEDDKKKAGSPYKWVCTGKHSIGVLGRIVHKGESITEEEYDQLPDRVKGFFEQAPALPGAEEPKGSETGNGDEDPKGGEGVDDNGKDGNND